MACGTTATPAAYALHGLRCLERASDPADMVGVVAITGANRGAGHARPRVWAARARADVLGLLHDARGNEPLPGHSGHGETVGDQPSKSP